MYAYELLPLLTHLTLTVGDNNSEHWEEHLEFVGTIKQWKLAEQMELVFSI